MKFNFKLPKPPKLSEIKSSLGFSRFEHMDRESYRLAALLLAGLVLLMLAAGLTAFFLSLRGAEQTMVPDLKGMELSQALVKLQEKELYPRLSLRFTDDPQDRGHIVEQRPLPGAIVKAGRRIQITVSRGPVVDRIENYVGQDYSAVKIHLQTLFASSRPLVTVKEPPVFVYDKAPAGTILEQKPAPGTEIGGLTPLELVLSRGPEKAQLIVPELRGLGFETALRSIEKAGIPTVFAMRKSEAKEKNGVVASQTPVPGSAIPANSRLMVTVTVPAVEKGFVSGIFQRDLPEYPYPLRISLEAQKPTGERVQLLMMNHPGGAFSVPYRLPVNSIIILSVLDRELARAEVSSP